MTSSDAEPLMQASRKAAHEIGLAASEADAVQQRFDARFGILQPVQLRKESQIFDGVQIAVEIGIVGKKSDVTARPFRFIRDVDALDSQLSMRVTHKRRRDFEERRLSRAVPSKQCQE